MEVSLGEDVQQGDTGTHLCLVHFSMGSLRECLFPEPSKFRAIGYSKYEDVNDDACHVSHVATVPGIIFCRHFSNSEARLEILYCMVRNTLTNHLDKMFAVRNEIADEGRIVVRS
jgi:hypothetical protein